MEKEKKQIYKKWWFWLIVLIIIFAVIGSSNNIENTTNNNISNNINEEKTDETQDYSNNIPSESNYKKYVYEIFDRYYKEDYNFSGDKKDWNIVNNTFNDYARSKLEGIAIINNERSKFTIILEFSDTTYTNYDVKYFQIGENTIIDE